MERRAQCGFGLVELLVALAIVSSMGVALSSLLLHNARLNRAEQMTVDAQANARNCLNLVVSELRSAGWDPRNTGLPIVGLDPDLSDDISEIEVFADLNNDGETDGAITPDDAGEQVLIRHVVDRVEWRTSADTNQPFILVAANISNDADGDGVVEPMFVPNSTTSPSSITVRITARSPDPDPRDGEFIRYTVSSVVALRKTF